MTIEIHKPEIMEGLKTGGFHSVEDALMQEFPYRELELEPARYPMRVHNVAF